MGGRPYQGAAGEEEAGGAFMECEDSLATGADDYEVGLPGPAPGDLLWRPALLARGQDRGASRGIAIQAPPAPPAGVSRLLSLARLVALGAGAIAGQFPGSG